MSDDNTQENSGYTVSFKTGPGFEASLVVVRGLTKKDLKKNLEAFDDDLKQLVVDVQADIQALAAAKGLTNTSSGSGNSAPSDGGEVKTCEHGKRNKRTGTSSRGAWTGWFCALPKGSDGACKPIFE